jgi:hypothetical protein
MRLIAKRVLLSEISSVVSTQWTPLVSSEVLKLMKIKTHSRRPPESHVTLKGRNTLFVNSVKYICVIFDKNVTLRLHIQMIEAMAFRIFIRVYYLFKSERLSANIKLTLHKALIRSIMTYAIPAWKSAADTHLIKLQRLQNKVFRNTGNFPRRTLVRKMHMAFQRPYIYDYITKLWR